MFETLARELETRYGLGTQADSFLRMLLAHMTDPGRGGLNGFVGTLRSAQWSVDDWLGNTGDVVPVTHDVVERALGGAGGLIGAMASKLGLGRDLLVRALAFAIPAVIGRLTPGRVLPASLPPEATAYIGDRREWIVPAAVTTPAAAPVAAARSGMGWLPWVIAALIAALLLGWCGMKKPADVSTPAPAATTPPPANETAPAQNTVPAPSGTTPAPSAQASEEPAGAGVLAWRSADMPALKVYFDSGSTTLSSDFADKAKELVDYLAANTDVKAAISGFNDPTGDPVKNAELSKNRAQAVQAALTAAGVAADRLELRKPADTTGTAATNAASRRVEVTLYK